LAREGQGSSLRGNDLAERSADWMDQAEGDLAHARSDLERGFYDWACFSTQQSAEKAVKAVLYQMGLEVWGPCGADLLKVLAEYHAVPPLLTGDRPGIGQARYLDALPTGSPPDGGTLVGKPDGWSPMPTRSFGSGKVFYPAFRRDELIERIRSSMEALRARLPVRRVVLFGSWARGRATAASDVDLLVYADPPRADAYAIVKRTRGIPRLELHVYAGSEYAQVRAVIERMPWDGVEMG